MSSLVWSMKYHNANGGQWFELDRDKDKEHKFIHSDANDLVIQ